MVLKTELYAKSGDSRIRLESIHLSQTQLSFMESCGRFAQAMGLSRSWGTIYGLLYLSPKPVGLQEVAQLSGISKGSASTGTRQLLAMGLIRKKWMQKEKRDFFEAVPSAGDALRNLYHNMLKTRVEQSQHKMTELAQMLESEKTSLSREEYQHIRKKLNKLDHFREKITQVMPAIDALLR